MAITKPVAREGVAEKKLAERYPRAYDPDPSKDGITTIVKWVEGRMADEREEEFFAEKVAKAKGNPDAVYRYKIALDCYIMKWVEGLIDAGTDITFFEGKVAEAKEVAEAKGDKDALDALDRAQLALDYFKELTGEQEEFEESPPGTQAASKGSAFREFGAGGKKRPAEEPLEKLPEGEPQLVSEMDEKGQWVPVSEETRKSVGGVLTAKKPEAARAGKATVREMDITKGLMDPKEIPPNAFLVFNFEGGLAMHNSEGMVYRETYGGEPRILVFLDENRSEVADEKGLRGEFLTFYQKAQRALSALSKEQVGRAMDRIGEIGYYVTLQD